MLKDDLQALWEGLQRDYRQKPRDIIRGGFLMLVLFSIALYGCKNKGVEKTQPQGVLVQVAKASRQDVDNTLSVVGTVHPFEKVAIKSRVDSQIMHVNFKNGDYVKKGETLFVLDDRVLKAQFRQLTADLARYSAELDRATRQLQRDKKLSTSGYSSQATFDNSKSTYEAASANVASTNAQIENTKAQLDFTIIKAPISGRAGTINVTQGNTVKANDTTSLVTINQMKPIGVKVPVPQRYFQAIQNAMKWGDVEVIAMDSSGTILDKGKILYQENAIDEETRTLSVQAVFDNRQDQLWPGMYVDTVIVLGVDKQALTIPIVSVRTGQNSTYVFIIREGKAVMKPIKVIRNHYDLAVIEGDIKEGDRVVTDGFLSLKDNVPVVFRQLEAKKIP